VRTRHAIALVAALALFVSGCTSVESPPRIPEAPVPEDRLVPLEPRKLAVTKYTELPTLDRYPDLETYNVRTFSYLQQLAVKAKFTERVTYVVIRPGEAVRCGTTMVGGGKGSWDSPYHICEEGEAAGTILINLVPLSRIRPQKSQMDFTFQLLSLYVRAMGLESGHKRNYFCIAGVLLRQLEAEGDLTARQALDGLQRYNLRGDLALHGYEKGTCPANT
jgi:hypothetical protein